MITLYQIPPAFGLPSLSPFCTKVENYLRMAGIPYETKVADLRKAPKGKVPFVKHEGRILADSTFIIDQLKKSYGDPLDAALTPEQHAIGHAVKRMLEEGTYFCGVYARWIVDGAFQEVKNTGFAFLPQPLRAIVPHIVRRKVRGNLYGQGTGRHTQEEVFDLGCRDLTALSNILGDKPFLLGDKPASYDATVAAFLGALIGPPFTNTMKEHLFSLPNLKPYYDRMWQRYYSDWKPN